MAKGVTLKEGFAKSARKITSERACRYLTTREHDIKAIRSLRDSVCTPRGNANSIATGESAEQKRVGRCRGRREIGSLFAEIDTEVLRIDPPSFRLEATAPSAAHRQRSLPPCYRG